MSTFSTRIQINAPKEKVWEVLAELGDVYKWNPGVSHSYSTSESSQGEGVTRHCDLQSSGRNIGYLEERLPAIGWLVVWIDWQDELARLMNERR